MTQDTNATLDLDLMPDVPETNTAFKQYGKLSISTKLFVWRNGKTEEASRADWMRTPAMQDGKGAKGMDITFRVDIQEFRPALAFTYERKVTLGGADWNRIVAPSLEGILGKGTMSKATQNATLTSLIGKYVAVEDTPQVPKRNAAPDAKVFNTVKFVKVYESREACLHDASEGFAGVGASPNGSAVANPNVPADYSEADWLSMKQDVLDAIAASIAKAEKASARKPKPVVAKAMADAKAQVLAAKATELAASVSQVEWLVSQ